MKKKLGKKKKIVIAVVVVAVLALAGMKMMGGSEEIVNPVNTSQISITDLQQIVSIKGKVEGSDRAEIASSANREIRSITVKEGDRVSRGQLLATLKPSDDDDNDAYAKEQAKNNVETAKFDYEAKKMLFEEGAVSKQDMLQAKAAYDNSVSTYNSLLNSKKSEKNEITSPIDGTVTRVNASVGLMANEIQNNAPLFVVENLDDLQMVVRVSEYDVGSIKVGQTVTISGQVLGTETVTGVVSRIAPTGEAKSNGTSEMVIPVTISITERNDHLIAGVSAKAEILTAEAKQVLTLPLDAMTTDNMTGENYVLVVEDGVVHKKIVTIGLESDFYAEIVGGDLKEGDRVVLNPTPEMADGMPVTDMTVAADAATGGANGGEGEDANE